MPQVQVIQPIQQQPKRLRVAAYARVSSDSGSAELAVRAGGLLHPLDTGKPQLGVRWNLH